MTAKLLQYKLVAFVLLLMLLLVGGFAMLHLRQFDRMTRLWAQQLTEALHSSFRQELAQTQARYLYRAQGFVQTNREIVAAFVRRDREQLTTLLEGKLRTLQREDAYFLALTLLTPDGEVFFCSRGTPPPSRNLNHLPFVRRALQQRPAQPMASLTRTTAGLSLAVGVPLFEGEQLSGLLLLQIRPQRELDRFARLHGIDSAIFIQPDKLPSSPLQQQERSNGLVCVAATAHFPPSAVQREPLLNATSYQRLAGAAGASFLRLPALPLEGPDGACIGQLVSQWDVSHLRQDFCRSLRLALGLGVLVLLAVSGLLYRGVGRLLRRLQRLYNELEQRVQQRTAELQRLNRQLEHEIEERCQAQRALEILSRQDGLTGVANRRHFDQMLARELAAARRSQAPLSLLMIDLDYFKQYNDRHGHLAGDVALKQVATALQQALRRPRDLVARFGGEEFICLLPETRLVAAAQVAERIRQLVRRLPVGEEPEDSSAAGPLPQETHLTVSVGVAGLSPADEADGRLLIGRADAALYRAKQAGRDRVVLMPGPALEPD